MPQLELTDAEELFLGEIRALSTNEYGERILVGLTVEESIWYIHEQRQGLAEQMDPDVPCETYTSRDRYFELEERHQLARLEVLWAEREVRTMKPIGN